MKRNSIFVKISSVVLAAFLLTLSSCVPAVDDKYDDTQDILDAKKYEDKDYKTESVTSTPKGKYHLTEAKNTLIYTNIFRTGKGANYVSQEGKTIDVPGLGKLTWDDGLEKAAKVRAQEIAKSFSHTRPNGNSCFTVFSDLGLSYGAKGENIAAGYSSAYDVFIGWKEDGQPYSGQGHRRNMLGENFTKIGIACFEPSEDVTPMNDTWPSSGKVTGIKYWVMELGK